MNSHHVSSPYCALAEEPLYLWRRRCGDCLRTNHTNLAES